MFSKLKALGVFDGFRQMTEKWAFICLKKSCLFELQERNEELKIVWLENCIVIQDDLPKVRMSFRTLLSNVEIYFEQIIF